MTQRDHREHLPGSGGKVDGIMIGKRLPFESCGPKLSCIVIVVFRRSDIQNTYRTGR